MAIKPTGEESSSPIPARIKQELPLQASNVKVQNASEAPLRQREAYSEIIAKRIETINPRETSRILNGMMMGAKTPVMQQKLIKVVTGMGPREMNILAATFTNRLPAPVSNESEDTVIVWRGLNASQLQNIIKHNSAGGLPADPDAAKPTEGQARAQVGEAASFPEFTLDPGIAEQFGTSNFVAVLEINKKYLTEGSGVEAGLIARKDAPVTLLAWKFGRSPIV